MWHHPAGSRDNRLTGAGHYPFYNPVWTCRSPASRHSIPTMQCPASTLSPRGVNISSGGYGYWPGSLPGITASRWTFPVVDAVTPKGWTLSWACRARTISGSPPYLPVLSPLLKELLYTLQLEHRPAGLIVYMVTGQCVQSITLS